MIRHRLAEQSCLRGSVGVKHHVEDPSGNEESEKVCPIGKMRQHRKDEYMHEALGKLSVVEGAYARNKAQHGRQPRTCRTYRRNIHSGGSIRGRSEERRVGKEGGA